MLYTDRMVLRKCQITVVAQVATCDLPDNYGHFLIFHAWASDVHIRQTTHADVMTVIFTFFTGPPSPITSITASDTSCLTTKYNVIVSWDPSTSDPVCGPLSYNVTISPSDGVTVMRITDTTYNFTTLTPGTDYTVTVAANNMAGVGQSNMTIFYIITMTEALPSGEFIM